MISMRTKPITFGMAAKNRTRALASEVISAAPQSVMGVVGIKSVLLCRTGPETDYPKPRVILGHTSKLTAGIVPWRVLSHNSTRPNRPRQPRAAPIVQQAIGVHHKQERPTMERKHMNERPRTPRRDLIGQDSPHADEVHIDETVPSDETVLAEGQSPRQRERGPLQAGETRTLEVREEQLVPHKTLREVGDVRIRKEVEQVTGRIEVDALREEVEVERMAVGEVVEEQKGPWQEGDTLVVPVYEERLVLEKRLVLKEQLRVRRRQATERHVLEEPVRREHVVIDDTTGKNVVRETNAGDRSREPEQAGAAGADQEEGGGPLERLARKLLE
ncbi:MAG: YsnF/AvaK domain-containing protein [Chloroflexota bacterium]